MHISEAEKITKLLDENDDLYDVLNKNKKLKLLIDSSDIYTSVFKSAKLIQGLPRQYSTHAAGIVLSSKNIVDLIPIQLGINSNPQTQYAMDYLEQNGLLKIDILGLRSLTFIKKTIQLINDELKLTINMEDIKLDDKKIFKILSVGATAGIFQLESPGMKTTLKKIKIDNFEDIVATTSLFRPGPQKQISKYISRKHGYEKITYIHSDLEKILKSTYGIIIYQEQIMSIVQHFAGLSLSKADIFRRAISKKDFGLINSIKNDFFNGIINKGYSEKIANEIYDLIYQFSEYGFNRSHAFSYSMISYQMAYLKVYFPRQFMTSLFNSVIGNKEKTYSYILELKNLGITLERPNINIPIGEYYIKSKKHCNGIKKY